VLFLERRLAMKTCPYCSGEIQDEYKPSTGEEGKDFLCPHCMKLISTSKSVLPGFDKANRNIKIAAIIGVIISCVYLISGWVYLIYSLISAEEFFGGLLFSIMNLGLSIGLFFKSRVCAILMMAIWIIAFLICVSIIFIDPEAITEEMYTLTIISVGSVILSYLFFVKGVKGTIAYHRMLKENIENPSA
jgi:hypothetical protein